MKAFATLLGFVVAAFYAFYAPITYAQGTTLDALFDELAQPDNPDWQRAESDILREWSKSGSAAMDLLLKRGEQAIETGDYAGAIAHLTALTDHAPDFAEGWNARATAYFLSGYIGPSLADIAQVLALEPRHFGALSGLGSIMADTGNLDGALGAYRAVLAIHPNRFDVLDAVDRLVLDLQGTDL